MTTDRRYLSMTFYGSYSNFTKSFIWEKKTMSRALPGWHSGDCASFVMRNYQGFESLTRLHCAVEKLATHEAHNLEIVGANPTCATMRDRLEVKVTGLISLSTECTLGSIPTPATTEISSAWPERLLWEQNVGGSNPSSPTSFKRSN